MAAIHREERNRQRNLHINSYYLRFERKREHAMKKIMTLILAAALCLTALVGCGDNAGTDSNNYDSKTFKVAVVQQLDHSSLNEIRDAIEAELGRRARGRDRHL